MEINNNHDVAQRPALGLQLLVQTLDELDLDAERACVATGLSRHFLETPGQLISRSQEIRFIEEVVVFANREDLAFRVGLRYHFGVYGVWGLALATSANLMQALEVAQEFIELTHSFAGLRLSASKTGAEIRLEQDYPEGAVRDFVIERDLMVTLMLASEIAGRRLPVEAVHIALPQPAHSALLERLLDCPVHWDSDFTAAYIRREELDKSLPQANPITWSACVRQCRELVALQRGQRGLAERVRDAIARTGFRGIYAVCEQLDISERSLRRRLREENTSFRELQRALRLALAEQYLADPEWSLEAIAERLGYSEPANFCHAFRGWTGLAPGQRRQQLNRNLKQQEHQDA